MTSPFFRPSGSLAHCLRYKFLLVLIEDVANGTRILVLRLAQLQYRKLLQARDGWHRNVIEHAIMSGQTQTFETVFDALRRDLLDDKVHPGVKTYKFDWTPALYFKFVDWMYLAFLLAPFNLFQTTEGQTHPDNLWCSTANFSSGYRLLFPAPLSQSFTLCPTITYAKKCCGTHHWSPRQCRTWKAARRVPQL